ncbi:TIGR01777 family oxidoreductase [Paenibacillus sp. JX-17]|uniref:TIGR01777 family oxidoreductase n=1 Tax=Paenibacillus lacisoli TaxID=3064525 RepID=A0ABT9CI62_9BACL|nr:TIGR01777 family oxidoreductase [Paenibacillus sp. JX-17]MDO7907303.1 TIGR01777 family oxidoreductase [Paenibacillus sp. JX-17]
MKIVVCGGTGFIGRALVDFWLEAGHQLVIVTREHPQHAQPSTNLSYISWDQLDQTPQMIEGIDALVNLSGETLNQRWTKKAKEEIIESRLRTVAIVAKAIDALQHKPEVVVQASAMAIYGTSPDKTFDENSPARDMNFPSHVAVEWEKAAEAIKGVRLALLRVSLVLGHRKGVFPLLKLPYHLGVGGRVGSGKQWNSWIHIIDMVRLIDFMVMNKEMTGGVNASSPNPVTNDEFGRTIGQVFHRPHWFPVPSFLIKTAVGELAVVLLEGMRVIPKKALDHGFQYLFPTLQLALEDLKSRKLSD